MDSELNRIAIALERIVELLEGKQGLLTAKTPEASPVEEKAAKASSKKAEKSAAPAADKPAAPAAPTPEKPAEKPADKPAPKAETEAVTIEAIRAKVNDLIKTGSSGAGKFKDAMSKLGVAKLSELPADKYETLMAALNA